MGKGIQRWEKYWQRKKDTFIGTSNEKNSFLTTKKIVRSTRKKISSTNYLFFFSSKLCLLCLYIFFVRRNFLGCRVVS